MGNILYRVTYRCTGGMEGHTDVWGEYGHTGGVQTYRVHMDVQGHTDVPYSDNLPNALPIM